MARKKKIQLKPLDFQNSFFIKENMKNYLKIQESSFQNYIMLYGIELEYFARSIDYYDNLGNIKNLFNNQGRPNKNIRDFCYFRGPECYGFKAMMQIRAILDYGTDNFMFTGFGLDNTNDGKMYITKRQFNQYCLQYFGLPKTANINIDLNISIINWKNITTVSFEVPFNVNENLIYKAEVQLPEFDINQDYANLDLGNIIKNISFPVSDINPEYSTSFENNKFVELDEDSISTTISDIKIDRLGTGSATVNLQFTIAYNSFYNVNNCHYETFDAYINEYTGETMPITFAPKVGDFIRLRMLDNPSVYRDYQIEFVNDVNLDKDAVSPFITNFCWECAISRRKPSHEEVEVLNNNVKQPSMEKGIESVIDNRQTQLMQDITREEEVYDYGDQFADVAGDLVNNIDYSKDAVFGSLSDPDFDIGELKGAKNRKLKSTKGKQIVPAFEPKEFLKDNGI